MAMVEEDGSNEDSLLAGLPNVFALSIMARLPCLHFPRLRCVSRSWNHAFRPFGSVFAHRRTLGMLEAWPLVRIRRDNKPCRWYVIHPRLLSSHRIPSPSSIHIEQDAGCELCIFGTFRYDMCKQLHFHCFDASGMLWQHSEVPAMHSSRFWFGSAILDGYWYVVGGRSRNQSSVERINIGNPNTLTSWECIQDMHQERIGARAVSRQGCLYVLGGRVEQFGQWSDIYSGEVWNPRTEEWMLVPQLWPFAVFGDHLPSQIAIVVVMGALVALKKLSKELMCYHDTDREWVKLGQAPLENDKHFRKLLGVGSELWLVSYCETSACLADAADDFWFEVGILNVAFLSGTLTDPPPNLSWRTSRIKFDGKIDDLESSVVHM